MLIINTTLLRIIVSKLKTLISQIWMDCWREPSCLQTQWHWNATKSTASVPEVNIHNQILNLMPQSTEKIFDWISTLWKSAEQRRRVTHFFAWFLKSSGISKWGLVKLFILFFDFIRKLFRLSCSVLPNFTIWRIIFDIFVKTEYLSFSLNKLQSDWWLWSQHSAWCLFPTSLLLDYIFPGPLTVP